MKRLINTNSTNAASVETLERRQLLAAATWKVFGSPLDDTIRIYSDKTSITVEVNGFRTTRAASRVRDIKVYAGDGRNVVDASKLSRKKLTVWGGSDEDYFMGGRGEDVFYAGADSDGFRPGPGRATFEGGEDHDRIDFSSRTDDLVLAICEPGLPRTATGGFIIADDVELVIGGSGDDHMTGNSQRNVFSGGAGNDTLAGAGGDDFLSGGLGDDQLEGGDGGDRLEGADGNDALSAGAGNDTLEGGMGEDRLEGADGDDSLVGGWGNDSAFGDSGNDALTEDQGLDEYHGGEGDDLFTDSSTRRSEADSFFGEGGTDTISFAGRNDAWGVRISVDGVANDGPFALPGSITPVEGDNVAVDMEVVIGTAYADALAADLASSSTLRGGAGNDTLIGSAFADQLFGEDGSDSIYGSSGIDRYYGGSGDDEIDARDGVCTDRVYGGDGHDTARVDPPAGGGIFALREFTADVEERIDG